MSPTLPAQCFSIFTIWNGTVKCGGILGVPASMFPDILPCAAPFGRLRKDILGREVPVCGVAGDQQSALFGQACFSPGDAKNTYGTGCFLLMNTGETPVFSQNRLLTTVAWDTGAGPVYALEGSVFTGGAAGPVAAGRPRSGPHGVRNGRSGALRARLGRHLPRAPHFPVWARPGGICMRAAPSWA